MVFFFCAVFVRFWYQSYTCFPQIWKFSFFLYALEQSEKQQWNYWLFKDLEEFSCETPGPDTTGADASLVIFSLSSMEIGYLNSLYARSFLVNHISLCFHYYDYLYILQLLFVFFTDPRIIWVQYPSGRALIFTTLWLFDTISPLWHLLKFSLGPI